MQAKKRRIIFMGTPDFAAIILKRLLQEKDFQIIAVFTQPDRKSGRGLKQSQSEVKKLALENGLEIFQPDNLRQPGIAELISGFAPDFIVVASYGLILPPEILKIANAINVHASLLPKYRGAAPIQRSMLENWGENATTGVCIMKMEKGLDTGPVYACAEVPIARKSHDELSRELAGTGADLLVETLANLDNIVPVSQDSSLATYAAKLAKKDGQLDWNEPAAKIEAAIRALTPWPGAQTVFNMAGNDIPVTIISAALWTENEQAVPGQLRIVNEHLVAGCLDAWLDIVELRPQGRNKMTGYAFANGRCRIRSGVCGFAKNIK